jgi:hypothetical protein
VIAEDPLSVTVIAAVNPLPQSDDTEYAAEHDAACATAAGGAVAATVRPSKARATADATTIALRDLLCGTLMKRIPPWIGYLGKRLSKIQRGAKPVNQRPNGPSETGITPWKFHAAGP